MSESCFFSEIDNEDMDASDIVNNDANNNNNSDICNWSAYVLYLSFNQSEHR